MLWLFTLLLTLWAGVAVITHAIQCPLPKPWNTSAAGCFSQVCCMLFHRRSCAENLTKEVLYFTHGNINIFTDLVIILIPVALLWDVQIKPSQKRTVCLIFATRIL